MRPSLSLSLPRFPTDDRGGGARSENNTCSSAASGDDDDDDDNVEDGRVADVGGERGPKKRAQRVVEITTVLYG